MTGAQRTAALNEANRRRLDSAHVIRDLRAGTVTITEAFRDPRAGSLIVLRLLSAQRGWGARRARLLLRQAAEMSPPPHVLVGEYRRVSSLTDRERYWLQAALGRTGERTA